ncbi:MAG: hypothetical protein ACXW6R_05885 [Candidatus Binatia bacterium]
MCFAKNQSGSKTFFKISQPPILIGRRLSPASKRHFVNVGQLPASARAVSKVTAPPFLIVEFFRGANFQQ